MEEKEIYDYIDYRDIHIDFYKDEETDQVYTIWKESPLCFGINNYKYKEDMKYIIDSYLDTVYDFKDKYYGAKLSVFNNNGFADIKLVYKGRILKIFFEEEDKENILKESIEILEKAVNK